MTEPPPTTSPFRDDRVAADVEAERAGDRLAQAEAEQAQARAFAETLRATRRRAWAAAAIVLLASGAIALVLWRHRPQATPTPAGPRVPDPARCATLASRYEAAWREANSCTQDDECAVTPRGRFWADLDGCARFGPRAASLASVDSLAQSWLAEGCATTFADCAGSAPVAAQCRGGSCVELPPAPIPADWVRLSPDRLFTFFVPPEVQRRRVVMEDSIGFAFEGPRFAFDIEYGQYAPTDFDPDQTPGKVLGRTAVSLSGHKGTEVVFQLAHADAGPARYGRVLAVSDAPCPVFATSMTCPRGTVTRFVLWAWCDRPEACEDARTAFESIAFTGGP
jgi:hypothetical protein